MTGNGTDDDETRGLPTADTTRPMPTDSGDPMHPRYTAVPNTTDTAVPDRPLDDPLPYGAGAGASATQQFGYGVAPDPEPVARRGRAGSPILAVAGLGSMGVAVWAIVGAPVISTTVMLTVGLVVAVLVGLVMVVRR